MRRAGARVVPEPQWDETCGSGRPSRIAADDSAIAPRRAAVLTAGRNSVRDRTARSPCGPGTVGAILAARPHRGIDPTAPGPRDAPREGRARNGNGLGALTDHDASNRRLCP